MLVYIPVLVCYIVVYTPVLVNVVWYIVGVDVYGSVGLMWFGMSLVSVLVCWLMLWY